MTPNLSVDLCGVTLKNPVMVASGTFGSGEEFSEFLDLNRLGAVVTKGVASIPWPGNPTPRICETPSGMLNAIGLQNAGYEVFIEPNNIVIKSEPEFHARMAFCFGPLGEEIELFQEL